MRGTKRCIVVAEENEIEKKYFEGVSIDRMTRRMSSIPDQVTGITASDSRWETSMMVDMYIPAGYCTLRAAPQVDYFREVCRAFKPTWRTVSLYRGCLLRYKTTATNRVLLSGKKKKKKKSSALSIPCALPPQEEASPYTSHPIPMRPNQLMAHDATPRPIPLNLYDTGQWRSDAFFRTPRFLIFPSHSLALFCQQHRVSSCKGRGKMIANHMPSSSSTSADCFSI